MAVVLSVENCAACICPHCTRRNCPRPDWSLFGKSTLDYCLACQQRERSVVYVCDFFRAKRLRKYYKVKKWYRRKDAFVQRLEAMEQQLTEIRRLLKHLSRD